MTGIKDLLNITDDDRRYPVLGKHKALELAAHPGTSYAAADTIRTQHALIVQMRDGMRVVDSIDVHASMTVQEADAISDQFETALAVADQYLGEQA